MGRLVRLNLLTSQSER